MLRNKLSKLIFGVMAAVMVLGTGISGQASHAMNSGVVAIAERMGQSETITDANASKIHEYIVRTDLSVLNIKNDVILTKDAVDAINKRTTPLEIVVENGATLVIDDHVNLNGTSSALKIVRGTGKTGELLQTKQNANNGVINVSIQGIMFDNGYVNGNVFSNLGSNIQVSLSGNRLIGGGSLSSSSNFDKVVCFDNEFYGGSVLVDGDNFETKYEVLNVDSAGADLNGTIKLSTKLGAGSVGLKSLKLEVISGSTVVKNISSNINNDGSVIGAMDGLNPGQNYSVIIDSLIDGSDNEYFFENQQLDFTTFKSSVSGVNTTSANIDLQHGSVLDTVYPLVVTVTVGQDTKTYTVNDKNSKTVSVTGLSPNTNYTYKIADKNKHTLDIQTFKTTSTQSSGSVITGGSSGSSGSTITGSGNSSVISGTITSNDVNKGTITDVTASIPVANSSLSSSLNNGKEFKTNIEGVTIKYSNGKVEFVGLVPEKEYKNLTVTYKDSNGNSKTVTVPTFTTKVSTTKPRQFIKDVYQYSLNRLPDEVGFSYWGDQIQNKKTSPEDFVRNLLSEKEFLNTHKTTAQKIEGLYKVIVNRASDANGLNFWTEKYNELIAKGYSESIALALIVDQMVNEKEFKTRVNSLGL